MISSAFTRRFELKFSIDEPCARAVSRFVRCHLGADEFNDPKRGNAYRVNSLYFDTPGLSLCSASREQKDERFKLRVRFYGDQPLGPVFFETKLHENNIVQKQRAMVRRAVVPGMLAGHPPTLGDLVRPKDGKAGAALRQFHELKDELQADGTVFVSYEREAYVSWTEATRVTIDRHLEARPYRHLIEIPHDVVRRPAIGVVVLELKYADQFPNWMCDLVQHFNLELGSISKYVTCVQALQE